MPVTIKMKKIGIIGGVGPESTVAYYRLFISKFQELTGSDHFPEFFIHNINMTGMLKFVYREDWHGLETFLASKINALPHVDYVAIASNTPHIVFDQLAELVTVPLISIVEETCKVLSDNGVNKVGLLGTRSTMTGGFYQEKATKSGISVITPTEKQQLYVHEKYMNELVPNKIQPETKLEFIAIVNQMVELHDLGGFILGGTELPLLLKQSDFDDLPVFDTAIIHVEALVRRMIE